MRSKFNRGTCGQNTCLLLSSSKTAAITVSGAPSAAAHTADGKAAHAHGNDVSSDTAGIVDPLRNRAKCTTELAMRSGTMRMGATPPNVMPFSPSGRTPTNFLPARMPRVPPWPLLVNSLPRWRLVVGLVRSVRFDEVALQFHGHMLRACTVGPIVTGVEMDDRNIALARIQAIARLT